MKILFINKPAWPDQIGRPQRTMKISDSGMGSHVFRRRFSDKPACPGGTTNNENQKVTLKNSKFSISGDISPDPRPIDCGDDAMNCLQLGHSGRLLTGIHLISSNLPSVIEKLQKTCVTLFSDKQSVMRFWVISLFILCLLIGTNVRANNILFLTLPTIMAAHGNGSAGTGGGTTPSSNGDYIVIGWNDLGMHCIDESFEDFGLLPPFNTLVAQVIKRGKEPKIVTSGIKVTYRILDNTRSDTKTNFWDYVNQLFGVSLESNIGLAGFGLQGTMRAGPDSFIAEGIPLTPHSDSAPSVLSPYQIAEIKVFDSQGRELASTRTVAPVSTEIHCDNCHGDGGMANPDIATGVVKQNILTLHDREEGTRLMADRPILCANCHASAALNKPGRPGLPSLSKAMHGKHKKIDDGTMAGTCYRCHPGTQTKCLRGIMFQKGQSCRNCHGNLKDLASSSRRPWVDEPRCGQCHDSAHSEPANRLYRFSRGHHGVFCQACHGSQHAIYPTLNPEDNAQSIRLQGHSGTIDTCRVCHTNDPDPGEGPHGGGNDD